MDKTDTLIKSILYNQQLILEVLKSIEPEDEEEDRKEMDDVEGIGDVLTASMIKAIKLTRSPHRTIASNY